MAATTVWEVVGGAEKGGITVKGGKELKSSELDEKLATNSLVEELNLQGDRLQYLLLEGAGPVTGWISVKITAKELAKKSDIRSRPPATVGPKAAAPLPVALLFPGQGSQYVGMLSKVQALPRVQEMLAQAKEILGYDILELCLQGPEEKLEETRFCQPAMFIAGLAGIEQLRQEKPEVVDQAAVFAGLSLGEYTALCAAGVFSFEDGLKLVQLRGEAMQEAAGAGGQCMLSVAGLDKAKLEELCLAAKAAEGDGAVCQIANELFPQGFSVGGTQKAIDTLKAEAEKAGALQAKVLKTAGAFHTPLMQPAQDKLAAALDELLPNMRSPLHTVWMNASATPVRPDCPPERIVALMKKQLTNPVLWQTSMERVIKEGITDIYEVGPMKQIKAMLKRIDLKLWKKAVNVEV